ncbi:hypothetical protein K1T71_008379 [Dendrolimus kikuchii]|uniref:Uncharacterized protein n=1 Tax=Dendrolimus kikuchii TaxID=765133 RepID=A0ACC1CX34_9NEOP|nr:hypothetical protein K1T71_008379 [Dendrolimus kikuchii]
MTRKFLFCFPLRVGNLVFGYVVILIAIAVVAYHIFDILNYFIGGRQPENRKWGEVSGYNSKEVSLMITMVYDLVYITLGFLLLFFAMLFVSGVHKSVHCLVKSFYVYSFIHLVLTLALVVWEGFTFGWIHFGLLLLADGLYILCLFGVKNLLEAIRRGYIYSTPGEEKNWLQ